MKLIAVTSAYNEKDQRSSLADGYIQAVEMAGGIPVILPPSLSPGANVQALQRVDGLLLSGGPDMSPLFYNQQPRPGLGRIDAHRDEQELALINEANKLGMPMLGICRGLQTINGVLGGTIVQHIDDNGPDAIQHQQKAPRWNRHHHIKVKADTMLASALGEGNIGVNSFHHQVVDKIASGFKVSATAPDGVVEAIERAKPWVMGVQWHPEMMWSRHPEFLRIFELFIAACEEYSNA